MNDLEIINLSLQLAAHRGMQAAVFDETKVTRAGGQFAKQRQTSPIAASKKKKKEGPHTTTKTQSKLGFNNPTNDQLAAGRKALSAPAPTNKAVDINKWNAAVAEIMKRDGLPADKAAENLANQLRSEAAKAPGADADAIPFDKKIHKNFRKVGGVGVWSNGKGEITGYADEEDGKITAKPPKPPKKTKTKPKPKSKVEQTAPPKRKPVLQGRVEK